MLRRTLARLSRWTRRVTPGASALAAPAPGGEAFQVDLDPDIPVPVWTHDDAPARRRAPVSLTPWPTLGLALAAGESVRTPILAIGPDAMLSLQVHADAGARGAWCVDGAGADGGWQALAQITVPAGGREQAMDLALRSLQGQALAFRVRRASDATGEAWLTLLRVSPRHQAGRTHALASYAFRLGNEMANFSGDAYRHAMYGEESGGGAAPGTVHAAIQAAGDDGFPEAMRERIHRRLAAIEPNPGEVAFNFGLRALGSLLPMRPPNFFHRARDRGQHRPLRILSLLAGAARVEEQLLGHCPAGAELTLIDASPDLIERAAARLQASHPTLAVQCLVGDINRGLPGTGRYDVILCVSALHHVADLERVLSQVNARLEDDGEFWSIGEQIGRNGNRLWPEALAAANAVFDTLPAHLRRNAHTGDIDTCVSDHDFSTGCFEGIRSEELEALLEAHLVPVDIYKRNAFLWRLLDATYGDNYRMDDPADIAHLKAVVAAEALHWTLGGRATELHGVYRKKVVPPAA